MKVKRIKFVLAPDPIDDSARLRIELLGDDGAPFGEVDVIADELTDDEQRQAAALFAYCVDEARRKAAYLREFSLEAGEHNRYRIELEMQGDFYEWHFRQRRDTDRWAGLGDDAVRTARSNR